MSAFQQCSVGMATCGAEAEGADQGSKRPTQSSCGREDSLQDAIVGVKLNQRKARSGAGESHDRLANDKTQQFGLLHTLHSEGAVGTWMQV